MLSKTSHIQESRFFTVPLILLKKVFPKYIKRFTQIMNQFSGVVLSHPETIVRDKYHHYNQLMSNNYKTYEMGPNFDSKLPQNVTAIHGKETELVCRVFELGNKTVSKIFALFFMFRTFLMCLFELTKKTGSIVI